MIERYLVSRLDTVPTLVNKAYPVTAPVGDDALPICLYSRTDGVISQDLSGAPVFYADTFRLDLLAEDMDALCALEHDVIAALTEQNVDAGDLYIFSGSAAPGIEDDYDLRTDTLRRSLTYTVTYWR